MQPVCFVLMPFGKKPDGAGRVIDFDAVYEKLIKPAITGADMEPLRADEERLGGVIHKQMFERLVICEFAVADLSTGNANVFYELGVRHAARPWSTVTIFSEGTKLPFDLGPVRSLPYDAELTAPEQDVAALTRLLRESRAGAQDSPVFQLMDGIEAQKVDHEKTDVFREQVAYSSRVKADLRQARKDGLEALQAVHEDLKPIADREFGVAVDLLLSYRAVKSWQGMVDLVGEMAEPHQRTTIVREQLAFGLNRAGEDDRAERILVEIIDESGPSSETNGLLGRVYKDRWEKAKERSDPAARAYLEKAIATYLQGFEADWRDAYPGINALTLMEIQGDSAKAMEELLPVVVYSAKRRLSGGRADYWDHATLLEAAILSRDQDLAASALSNALVEVREPWEPETTARNLRLISELRAARSEENAWIADLVKHLLAKAEAL